VAIVSRLVAPRKDRSRAATLGFGATITFESEERLVGSTGYNQYFAPVQLSGTTLRIGAGASTRRACPPAVMTQEQRFLAALTSVTAFRHENRTLWLIDAAGPRASSRRSQA